jgi:hypothetical protein
MIESLPEDATALPVKEHCDRKGSTSLLFRALGPPTAHRLSLERRPALERHPVDTAIALSAVSGHAIPNQGRPLKLTSAQRARRHKPSEYEADYYHQQRAAADAMGFQPLSLDTTQCHSGPA